MANDNHLLSVPCYNGTMITKDYYNDFFELGQQKINFSFFELCLPDDDPVYTLKKVMEDLDFSGLLANCSDKERTGFNPKSLAPISNGGLIFAPPGHFTGSARDGISQYHYYWFPSLVGLATSFHPLTCHFLPVPEYNYELFLHLHFLLLIHNILLPRNACLRTLFYIPDACRIALMYSYLSDKT